MQAVDLMPELIDSAIVQNRIMRLRDAMRPARLHRQYPFDLI